jgi:hypothetical protein
VIDDVNKGRIFAYLTRWRDPEELYTRVLYAMFVAPADHLPHIFSGDMPNGFAAMWKKVNEVIFEGNGMLFKEPGWVKRRGLHTDGHLEPRCP